MDWQNESYVRLYTKDTPTWRRLKWEGQAVLSLLLRKIDQSGVMDGIEDVYDDVSIATGMNIEDAKKGLDLLLKYEVFKFSENTLFMPNFLEAQTASKSDKQRQKESRDNRKAKANIITNGDNVSQNVTDKSQNVTKCHTSSQPVTSGHSLHCNALHDITLPCNTLLNTNVQKIAQDQFDEFWKLYPNRKNKKGSKAKFLKLTKDKNFDFDLIMSQLQKQVNHVDWIKDNGRYVPLPTTWLNNEKWNDEINDNFSNTPQTKQDEKQALFDKWNREIAEEEANEKNNIKSDAIVLNRV